MSRYTSRNISSHKAVFESRKKWGLGIIAAALILLLFSATNLLPFLNNFLLGVFGLAIFPVILTGLVIGIALLQHKKYVFSKKYSISLAVLFICLIFVLQLAFTSNLADTFSTYVGGVYTAKITPGGVLVGVFAYFFALILTPVGAYVLAAIAAVVAVALIINHLNIMRSFRMISERTVSFPEVSIPKTARVQEESAQEHPATVKTEIPEEKKEFVPLTLNARQEKSARELAKEKLGMIKGMPVESLRAISTEPERKNSLFTEEFIKSVKANSRPNTLERPKPKQEESYSLFELIKRNEQANSRQNFVPAEGGRPPKFVHEAPKHETLNPFVSSPKIDEVVRNNINSFALNGPTSVQNDPAHAFHESIKQYTDTSCPPQQAADEPVREQIKPITESPPPLENIRSTMNETGQAKPPEPFFKPQVLDEGDLDLDIDKILSPKPEEKNLDFNNVPDLNNARNERLRNVMQAQSPRQETVNQQKPQPQQPAHQTQPPKPTQMKMAETEPAKNKNITKYSRPSPYVRPHIELLTTVSSRLEESAEDYQTKALILEQTLENFKIPAKVKAITHGPAVTRYELQMPPGIPVKRISQHADDIAMTLEASGAVRIEAPIPGKGLVGIEVPNAVIATIALRDIIDSQEFMSNKAPLVFALGKDISGAVKVCDLHAMPHLLVAGSTGSGKSVCLNAIILSFLYKLAPEDLKLILIDPKRVEFTTYSNLPHMLLPDAITDPEQALNALNWAIKEMERRYELFASKKIRDFKEYNALPEVYNGTEQKLPRIVIIVDELADLMMTAKRDMEEKIKRLAQLARAAGMHLIIATQRPSVDVITGTIKSNLPSRIAFAVTNFADSKTILDSGGADKLLGKGDMLYAPQNLPEPIRVQGAFVSNTEVNAVCEFIKTHNQGYFDSEMTDLILNGEKKPEIEVSAESGGSEYDPLLPQALKMFMETGQGSISMIQRRYSVGFARAARIVDQMELAGYLSPQDPSNKNRTVLITPEKYVELFGSSSGIN